jgi:hypothetical protein
MVPIHGLWTPHNVTLVLGLAAEHHPLPALFDYAVTVNPQRRAMLGAAAHAERVFQTPYLIGTNQHPEDPINDLRGSERRVNR